MLITIRIIPSIHLEAIEVMLSLFCRFKGELRRVIKMAVFYFGIQKKIQFKDQMVFLNIKLLFLSHVLILIAFTHIVVIKAVCNGK